MFDDQPNPKAPAPANLPVEADDMFASVDQALPASGTMHPDAAVSVAMAPTAPSRPDALDAGLLKRKVSAPVVAPVAAPAAAASVMPAEMAPVYPVKGPVLGKILFVLFGSLALLGIVVGGWWFYGRFIKKEIMMPTPVAAPVVETTPVPAAPVPEPSPAVPETPAPVTATSPSEISTSITNDTLLFGEPVDSDHDGLDDVREKAIGTDPNNPDTDGDRLTDGDEVIIWKTNPLNPDTDADTYPDGTEVRNGYNPLGPGKLFLSGGATAAASTTATSSR